MPVATRTDRDLEKLDRLAGYRREEEELVEGALPHPMGFGQLGSGALDTQPRFSRDAETWPEFIGRLIAEAGERREELMAQRETLEDEWDLFLCDIAISAQCNMLFISYFGPSM